MSASEHPGGATAAHAGGDTVLGRLTIGRRLGLLVGLLWLAVVGLTVMAALGLGRIDRDIQDFHDGTFRHAALTVDLRGALKNTEIVSLEYALIENEPRRVKLRTKLSGTLIPAVDEALLGTERTLGETHEATRRRRCGACDAIWQLYLESAGPALLAADADGEQAAAVKIRSILDRTIADAELLAAGEASQAATEIEGASAAADSIRRRLIVVAVIAGLIATGIAILSREASFAARATTRGSRQRSRRAATASASSSTETTS